MEFSEIDMTAEVKMTLRLRYTGEQTPDFTPGREYYAKKLKKEGIYGNDGFLIFDDSEESYPYSGKFIREDFQLLGLE